MKNIVLILLICFAGQFVNAQEIKWMSMNEALTAQKKEPRKIFMDVFTDWCGPCKMLDENTFHNKDVAEYVNENFYAVKFNAEGTEEIKYQDELYANPGHDPDRTGRNSQHAFAQAMGINAYPSMVFFDEEGNFIQPIPGYLTPEQLEIYLKIIATDDFKKIT
ncbi:MAG: thioredoxin fold domain-containing protein, partial [Leeuwenhoekiella sp.]